MIQSTGFLMPVPSTDLLSEVIAEYSGAAFLLRFEYDREGTVFHSGLTFQGVRAFRFRGTFHCDPKDIESSYDALAEVLDSSWVRQLILNLPIDHRTNVADIHHYMLTLDSTGCFEIVARSWDVLGEEYGYWDDKQ